MAATSMVASIQTILAYAAVVGLIFIGLSILTIAERRKASVYLGAGDNDRLLRRIRAHANFAEYVPLALILIAGVAHEINNPLNNISMIAETYEDMYEKLSPEQRMEFMGKVESETVRIKGIVKNLLDFAKPKEPERISADINEVVNKTLKLVQNMLNVSDIEVGLNLAEELPLVYVDVPQIQQVFVNLITNAIQAMPDGGKLNISTRLGKEPDTIETGFLDSGKGIPQEFLAHVFDPFFSTKEEGGMGLGLWVSYGIVKSQGGNILVESKVGTGTIFTVQLPVYKEKGEIE